MHILPLMRREQIFKGKPYVSAIFYQRKDSGILQAIGADIFIGGYILTRKMMFDNMIILIL